MIAYRFLEWLVQKSESVLWKKRIRLVQIYPSDLTVNLINNIIYNTIPTTHPPNSMCGLELWTLGSMSIISLDIKRRGDIKLWQKYLSMKDQLALARLNYENSFFSFMVFFCPGLPKALYPPLPQMWLPAVSFEESSGDFTAGRWCLRSCNESGPNVFLLPLWVGESLHPSAAAAPHFSRGLHIPVKAAASEVTVWSQQGVRGRLKGRKQSGLINPCW